jgi:hypothetical protein
MRNGFLMALSLFIGVSVWAVADAEAGIPPTWCTHTGAQLLIGDVNNDPFDDRVCHDRNTGAKWVALGSSSGFNEVWSSPSGWCAHAGATLFLGDVNGDGSADLVCRDPGRVWIDYASPAFFEGTDWVLDTAWCTHTGATLFLADQNNDGRVDLTCRDTSGFTWVDFADSAGHYAGTDVGRAAIDLEVTNIIRGATTHQINLRNNGAPGVVTRVECTEGSLFASKSVSISLGLGGTASTFITSLPLITGVTVRCTAFGTGTDGLSELFLSNNAFSKFF